MIDYIYMKADKDMIITDVLAVDEGIISILMGSGMHCIGCLSARGETLEEACEAHGLDADALIEEINTYLATLA